MSNASLRKAGEKLADQLSSGLQEVNGSVNEWIEAARILGERMNGRDRDRLKVQRQAAEITRIIAERDAALARVKELEAELVEEARVNGIGSECEAGLMARAEKAEADVKSISKAIEMVAGRYNIARRQVEAVETLASILDVPVNTATTRSVARQFLEAMKEAANAE